MGFMDKVLGNGAHEDDYLELDESDLDAAPQAEDTTIYFAEIGGQQDLLNIKDTLYDGNIVIADIKSLESTGMNIERVQNQLQQVVNEIGGDIIRKQSEQLVLTPDGVGISRDRL